MRCIWTAPGTRSTTIRGIWAAFGLQPHRSETFKLSSDPLFVDKVRDIVGLYLSSISSLNTPEGGIGSGASFPQSHGPTGSAGALLTRQSDHWAIRPVRSCRG